MFIRKKEKESRIPVINEFEIGFNYLFKKNGKWIERTFKKGDSINEVIYYLKIDSIKVYIQ